MPCDRKLGCHECENRLMFLHAQIRQTLRDAEINLPKIREELLSVKRFIEDVVGVGEDEV
jgi:hypothetical protein